jgi:hypothetical protein
MPAKFFKIKSKNKPYFLSIPSLDDFDYQEANTVDINIILEKPNISLYCLDFSRKWAIFVETDPEVDIDQFPFFYQAQYDHAKNLIAITFSELLEIGKQLEIPENLVIVYSVGRCGSTLVHSAFNQLENTLSLSEPGVYDQLVIMRQWDGSNDAEISELIESCTKILCTSSRLDDHSYRWVIKLRSYGIEIADLIFKHFPKAKIIFLYRDTETWMKSVFRASLGEIPNTVDSLKAMQNQVSQVSPLIHQDEQDQPLSYLQILTLAWLSVMEGYLRLHQQGVLALAIRFQDLITAPQQTIIEILKYCDLPTTNLIQVFEVLQKDSQADTILSKANLNNQQVELTEEDLKEIRATLQEHSTIKTSDFIVPNTLDLKRSEI